MLRKGLMKMKVRTFAYFLGEAFKSFRRNSLMTLASIATVALSLFILGMFLTTVLNLTHMASYLENQVELSVYLKDGLTTQQIGDLERKIRGMNDIKSVSFVNKDQALSDFKERLGEQSYLLDSLNGNPLPSSFSVVFANPEAVREAARLLDQDGSVETAQYGQDTIEQLFEITRFIRIGGTILILFLAFSTLFIISNTIRMTVFARRREIQIMKYVGATNSFIRWPFLLEGMMLGLVGSIISGVCLWQMYRWGLMQLVAHGLAFLPMIPTYPFIIQVGLGLILIGICIGGLGSTISVRKYMKV